jgi:actin related protein 2/3 complex, subunit 1A/1B
MGSAREESALNMFRQMDLKGKAKDDTQLKTTHQNTISTIRTYDESGGTVRKFSSESAFDLFYLYAANSPSASGVDGRVVIWIA